MPSTSPATNGAADEQLAESSPSTTNNGKRKAEPNSGTHTRSKRNRYISLACNECKRRKIKCNGQMPCQRCGHLSLECLYAPNCCSSNFKDSQEFRSMTAKIDRLQAQVNTLFANINGLHRDAGPPAPADGGQMSPDVSLSSQQQLDLQSEKAHSSRQQPKHPRFRGPTSSAFNFDVAKSSLQTMGIASTEDGAQDLFASHHGSPGEESQQQPAAVPQLLAQPGKDPLWTARREETVRLCRVYEEEIGIMYPILDIEKLIQKANALFDYFEAADRTRLTLDCPNDDDINILKLVLAITLIVEGHGQSALGTRYFNSVRSGIETSLWDPVDVKNIVIFALVGTYYFHTDEDTVAYRMIGVSARMCLEMGLHRREALMKAFDSEEEIEGANRLFWSVYSLDRRWSVGTGLPFVIQDGDIDDSLPEPDDSVPYLKEMVKYCRLCSKVWYSGLGSEGTASIKRDEIGFLDYQVCQWMKNIPDHMKFYSVDAPENGEHVSRGRRRLRLLLYIRGNHLRILIYRPVLHSATSIVENMPFAQTVVDIAKDTIRVLTRLNQTSDIYRSQQMLFNYFLIAALAVLFLAVSHAPVEFNRQVRDEFYMALDLIKYFSTKSYVSKRLWKMIKGLREIGEKLGLFPRAMPPEPADPHASAAATMAGLAQGHPMEVLTPGPYRMNPTGELGNSPTNGIQMSNELNSLFEAVGGYNGGLYPQPSGSEGMNGEFVPTDVAQNSGEGLAAGFGSEGDFSRIMADLF